MDKEKALHAVLYILNKLGGKEGMLKLFKILYFAEIKHLSGYGRTITEDDFIKMDNGPVPSMIYDHLKGLRIPWANSDLFQVENYNVTAKVNADLDELSKTDIECINESIAENKDLGPWDLSDKSHSVAWTESTLNRPITFELLAREAGLNEDQLNYALESK